MLSVVVPAYDEADRLPPSLRRMRAYLDGSGLEYEVIVVDDGSTDATSETVTGMCQEWPQLSLIRQSPNQGKGAAVRTGMLRARGEHRLFSDADLSTPIEDLRMLCAALDGGAAVDIASRAASGARVTVHQAWRRELMGKTYNRLLRLLVLPGIRDSQCGFKLFTAEAAVTCFEPLRTRRFGFDAEALLRARKQGWRVAEVPVSGWQHVEASRVSAVRDASRMLLDLVLLRIRGV